MNTSRTLAACGVLALSLQTAPAAADSGPWYVGAGVGQASYGLPNNVAVTVPATTLQPSFQLQDTNKQSATAYRLDGGYRFGQYFALEGLYADFGSVTSDVAVASPAFSGSGHIQEKVWGAEAVALLPLNGGFDLFARAGWVRYHTDLTALQVETSADPFTPGITGFSVFENSDSGSTPVFGAGGDYELTGNWSLRAAFDYVQGKTGSSYTPGVHLLSLELLYHF